MRARHGGNIGLQYGLGRFGYRTHGLHAAGDVIGHLAGLWGFNNLGIRAAQARENGFHAVQRFQIHLQVGPQEPRRAEQVKIVEVYGQAAALVHVQRGREFVDDVYDFGNEYSLSGIVIGNHLGARLLKKFERAVIKHEQKLPLIRGAYLGLKICLRRFVHMLSLWRCSLAIFMLFRPLG